MTMGKTNFDRITASPEALASFLASPLPGRAMG